MEVNLLYLLCGMRTYFMLLDHCLNDNFENGKISGVYNLQNNFQITKLRDDYEISNLYIEFIKNVIWERGECGI